MSEPDVVTDLDYFIRQLTIATSEGLAMQRARDDIVALRTLLIRSRSVLRTCAYDRPSDLDQMRSDVIWRLIQEIDSAMKEKP